MSKKQNKENLPPNHYTVYKLTDPEGKVYIGCTGEPVQVRWSKGYNKKTKIREAIDRLGWDVFKKDILCEKLIRSGAEELEKKFIAYYDSANSEKGYNRALGGLGEGSRRGIETVMCQRAAKKKFLEEHPEMRDEISRKRKEYLSHPEHRAFQDCDRRPKPVLCVETGAVYRSIRSAIRITGFQNINHVCLNDCEMAGGCHWRLLTEEEKEEYGILTVC